MEDAVRLLDAYSKRHPSSNVLIHLAKDLAVLERWDDFEKALTAAEVIVPLRGSIPLLRDDRLLNMGRFMDAVKQYERAMEVDPHRMGSPEREKLRRARKMAGLPPD